ncbi:hypothetical protein ACFLXP_02420 [Chloroflexota bacterium]
MAERPNELKKLADIAGDTGISAELRTKSVELIGKIGTHDALLVLLELAANKELATEEREYARDIIKAGR